MAEQEEATNYISLVLGPDWLTAVKNPRPEDGHKDARFRLIAPSSQFITIRQQKVQDSEKIESIHLYYNSAVDLRRDMQNAHENSKIKFLLTRDLSDRLSSLMASTVLPTVPKSKSVQRKKASKAKNVSVPAPTNPAILCRKCSMIMDEPFQLSCGHRQCKICIDKQDQNVIACVECDEQTPRKDVWFDRGFQKSIDKLKKANLSK